MLNLKLNGPNHNGSGLELHNQSSIFPTSMLGDVRFVRLDKPPRVLESIPQPLLSLLAFLKSNLSAKANHHDFDERVSELPALLVLPSSNLGPGMLVPLAGILLDYPFAYVPPDPKEGNETYLSGEALDVFEIQLRSFETGESLELMKFSCPAEFSAATSTLNTVRERLGGAVDHLNSNRDGGHGPFWEIISEKSRVIVDRVAL